jgi:hypothetical protein
VTARAAWRDAPPENEGWHARVRQVKNPDTMVTLRRQADGGRGEDMIVLRGEGGRRNAA